jgi:hypothetical protein
MEVYSEEKHWAGRRALEVRRIDFLKEKTCI